eukprot:GEMP01030280.1.p1 GENE.GEMP01030280.1~~GEMP01030280.1.p1  ORF type:complete len:296 (+),score=42.37 GEMP01030280.1:62-889(+)
MGRGLNIGWAVREAARRGPVSEKVTTAAGEVAVCAQQDSFASLSKEAVNAGLQEVCADVFLMEDFITEDMERVLLAECNARTWTPLTQRRFQNVGGVPLLGTPMAQEPIPAWLQALFDVLPFHCNHSLLNSYDENVGIGAHFDGPQFAHRAAVVSLQGACVLDLVDKAGGVRSIFLPARSLLIFKDSAYTELKHGISAEPREVMTLNNGMVTSPVTKRVSITCREVLCTTQAEISAEEKTARLRRWMASISERREDARCERITNDCDAPLVGVRK